MDLTVKHLLNPNFDFQNLDLSTCIHDVFGFSDKLAEFLMPDEERLYNDDYTDEDICLERLFEVTPNTLLHWHNENYKQGFYNTEIDVIGFVLQQTLIFCADKPKINRFFSKPYKQSYL